MDSSLHHLERTTGTKYLETSYRRLSSFKEKEGPPKELSSLLGERVSVHKKVPC